MKFSIRLKQLREVKNITQMKLAKYLKISGSTVAMWESDNRIPPAETLSKIASYFDVTVDYLIGRTQNPLPNNQLPTNEYELSLYNLALAERGMPPVEKIFDTTKEALFGSVEETSPSLNIPESLKGIPIAFHGGIEGLSQEGLDDIAEYIEFIKAREQKKNK